jgi:hypothetical protein
MHTAAINLFAEVVAENTSLQQLRIYGAVLPNLPPLLDALASPTCGLTRLEIDLPYFVEVDLEALTEAIRINTTLTSLNFGLQRIANPWGLLDMPPLYEFSEVLSKQRSLNSMEIRFEYGDTTEDEKCKYCDDVLSILGPALVKGCSLWHLRLPRGSRSVWWLGAQYMRANPLLVINEKDDSGNADVDDSDGDDRYARTAPLSTIALQQRNTLNQRRQQAYWSRVAAAIALKRANPNNPSVSSHLASLLHGVLGLFLSDLS